jgi:ribonuclease E
MTEGMDADTDDSDLIESAPNTDERRPESGKHNRRPRKRGGREEHRAPRPNQARMRSDRSETANEPAAESVVTIDLPREVDRDVEAAVSTLPAQATTAASEPLPAAGEDTAARRWQPPTATISEPPAQPKSGWWRRKSG